MPRNRRPTIDLRFPIELVPSTPGTHRTWWLDFDPADGSLLLQAVDDATGRTRNVARLTLDGSLTLLGSVTAPGAP